LRERYLRKSAKNKCDSRRGISIKTEDLELLKKGDTKASRTMGNCFVSKASIKTDKQDEDKGEDKGDITKNGKNA